jgi:hypothetical protein
MQTARLTVLLAPEAKSALEDRAAALKLSASELVRRAVDAYDPEADPDAMRLLSGELAEAMARIDRRMADLETAFDVAEHLAAVRVDEAARMRRSLAEGAAPWPFAKAE